MPAACGQPLSVRANREDAELTFAAAHGGASHFPQALSLENANVIAVKRCEDFAVLRKAGLLPFPGRAHRCRWTDGDRARSTRGANGPEKQPALAAHQETAAAFLKAHPSGRPGRQRGEQIPSPRPK